MEIKPFDISSAFKKNQNNNQLANFLLNNVQKNLTIKPIIDKINNGETKCAVKGNSSK